MSPNAHKALLNHAKEIARHSSALDSLLQAVEISPIAPPSPAELSDVKPTTPLPRSAGADATAGLLDGAIIPPPDSIPGRRRKVALIVGHEPTKPGAVNKFAKVSEFDFNNQLVRMVSEILKGRMDVEVVYRHTAPAGLSNLAGKVNALRPDFAVSFHANAYNESATGTETLYYRSSTEGKELAGYLQTATLAALGLRDRGLKWRHLNATGTERRGALFLGNTSMPAAMVEPFFIDNDSDLATARQKMARLAEANAAAITHFARVAIS